MMTWSSTFFQSPSSLLMESISFLHDYTMMFLLTVLMMVLLKMTFLVLNSNFNSEFFENHQLETIWTLIPFIILMFIALPSLKSLYLIDTCLFCGMNVTVIGHQWYWSYKLNHFKEMMYDSYMIESSNRLLDTDNRLMVPTNIPIRFNTTSSDVIHSWTIPSLGFKMDSVPGRLNQFCLSTKKSGVYFGQCSEICGANHSFMPIVMESIPLKMYMTF